MSDQLKLGVGKWYRDAELDEQFRVLAIDEEREVVEIQYLDGEADEIELEAWSTSTRGGPKHRRGERREE